MKIFYGRTNYNVCFIFPAIATGVDIDGRVFFEIAWLFYAVGFG